MDYFPILKDKKPFNLDTDLLCEKCFQVHDDNDKCDKFFTHISSFNKKFHTFSPITKK